MRLQLLRINSQSDYTSGILFQVCDDGSKEFMCYTLEDEGRDSKVMHETRIPAGVYEIAFRKVGGFHQRYKKRFKDIHKGMLELIGVPNFQYILIHCGNTDDNTSGCILVGQTQEYGKKNGWVGRSTQAYFDIYPLIADALDRSESVEIEIVDFA